MFFGTPALAVPSLEALLASGFDVVAVVTNPDRVAGRGLRATQSPVKSVAMDVGVEVMQPERIRSDDFRTRLEDLSPDICCVVAYGKILPPSLLEVPALGFVNAHFSVLPAYRGAAPVQWALINGEKMTGVSIMVLSEGMDEGPLLASVAVPILDSDSAATLGPRLATLAGPLLVRTITDYGKGILEPRPQPGEGVSYAPKLEAHDARIDWTRDADVIRNLVRGANPEPGAWTTFHGKRLKIFEAELFRMPLPSPSGSLQLTSEGLMVACGEGALTILSAQIEGKRRLSGAELGRGLRLEEGDRLE